MVGKCQLEEISPICPQRGSEWAKTGREELLKWKLVPKPGRARPGVKLFRKVGMLYLGSPPTQGWAMATLSCDAGKTIETFTDIQAWKWAFLKCTKKGIHSIR